MRQALIPISVGPRPIEAQLFCLYMLISALKMEVLCSSEKLAEEQNATWLNIPEDYHLVIA
jgi:hypothetical protein